MPEVLASRVNGLASRVSLTVTSCGSSYWGNLVGRLAVFNAAAGCNLTKQQARDVIEQSLEKVTGTIISTLPPDTLLTELGIDSLGFTEVLLQVEELLGVEFPAAFLDTLTDIPEIKTLEELLTFFEA